MPFPSIDELQVLATNQDIALTPERLAQAYATHAATRPALEQLRRLPLSFLEPTEPAAALLWIRNGGRS
ncbi:hypothetical protein GCM10009788_09610 [Nocardioides humi]|uniref:Uncharacterized protein n=1 Tax=Nocardioides humi TaxID=449461 RepID=A0ABN1ZYR7_9ACTN